MFWESTGPTGSFVIHFTDTPESEFGAYGRSYALAAKNLLERFLSSGSADFEAYPVVFLYRHALELYLKGMIVKGGHLADVRGQQLLPRVTYDHNLDRLFKASAAVLRECFSKEEVSDFIERLKLVTTDMAKLDKDSFLFRYPVDKTGSRPVSKAIHGSVAAIAGSMDPLLEELDRFDTALDVETDIAIDELSSYLHDAVEDFRE